MTNGDQRAALDAAFRIGREQATDALLEVLVAHQPAAAARSAAALRKRAQSAVIGIQETIASAIVLPQFVEELGAILCGVTDGSDEALLAATACVEDALLFQIPPALAEQVREPALQITMRLMLGWLRRREMGTRPPEEIMTVVRALRDQAQGEGSPDAIAPLRSVFDQAPLGMMVVDLSVGLPVLYNPALERLFGFSLEEEIALPPEQMQNEDSADDDFDLLGDMVAGRIPFLERISARPHKDGHSVPFHLIAWPVRNAAGEVTHLVNLLRHADAQSAATAGSGLAEKRARFLMQISPDPVVISSAEGIIRYASPSMETVFGQDPDSFIGRNVRTLVTDGSDEAGRQMMQAVVGVPRARVVAELETNLSGGGSRWFEVVATNMLDVDDVHGIVFQARDITDRRELQARLEHMAKTESLTGLLNRRGFLDGLRAWLESRRSDGSAGDDAPVACFIDLDDFKSINDRYGHAAGDAALVAVGSRLADLIDGRGFVGRMGGDEFVLLAELADEAERDAFIRDLESALHGSVVHGDQEIVFAGSAGTIDLRARVQGTDGASGILRDADHELQRAKTRRRSMASGN